MLCPRYKADLLLMTKREDSLRTEAAQDMRLLTLRCEAAESRAYGNQEEFVQEVISAKEKVCVTYKIVHNWSIYIVAVINTSQKIYANIGLF